MRVKGLQIGFSSEICKILLSSNCFRSQFPKPSKNIQNINVFPKFCHYYVVNSVCTLPGFVEVCKRWQNVCLTLFCAHDYKNLYFIMSGWFQHALSKTAKVTPLRDLPFFGRKAAKNDTYNRLNAMPLGDDIPLSGAPLSE